MNILALDLSLTGTGWARTPGDFSNLPASGVLRPPKGYDRGEARLSWITSAVQHLAKVYGTHVAVLEGYAFGRTNQAHQMGELGGVVRLALYQSNVPMAVVPPSSMKKFATGKGNAGKEEVTAAAIRRLGFDGHDNNVADAMWLLEMALHGYGISTLSLPKTHTEAVSKVSWPEVSQKVA
jgi:crossover junction endodeoxyribonuclease RuvC